MCRALSEGGQRCFGHARDAWLKARQTKRELRLNGAVSAEYDKAVDACQHAQSDLASTGKGRAFLVEHIAADGKFFGSELNRLVESVEVGMALRDIHDEHAAAAAENETDRATGHDRVAHRAKVAAATLRRAAKINMLTPIAAVPAYVAATNPSPEALCSTALTLVSVAGHAWWQHGKTAPVDRHTSEDQRRYAQALDRAAAAGPAGTERALAAIEDALAGVDDPEAKDFIQFRIQRAREESGRSEPTAA